jgi:hypothetical protein
VLARRWWARPLVRPLQIDGTMAVDWRIAVVSGVLLC